jgi:phospholipase/carboxylesterase
LIVPVKGMKARRFSHLTSSIEPGSPKLHGKHASACPVSARGAFWRNRHAPKGLRFSRADPTEAICAYHPAPGDIVTKTGAAADTALKHGVPAAEAGVVCAVIHGRYGAPEAMMEHLVGHLTAPDVHYVLPRCAAEGWYAAPTCAPFGPDTEAEIARALSQVQADIDEAIAEAPAGTLLMVGGFSQGACLTIEYAATRGPWNGALFALTGCRVGACGHGRFMPELGGMPAYVSTGSGDPLIKVAEFSETIHALARAGARVRSDLFPRTDHVMSPTEVATVDAMLRRVAAGEPLFQCSAA